MMSIVYSEDLKAVARYYGELRLQAISSLRKMSICSMTLFKAFLQYVEKRRAEGLELPVLLNEFSQGNWL